MYQVQCNLIVYPGNVYTTNSLTVNRELNINGIRQVQFEDIEINDNYITTTPSQIVI